MSAEIITPIAPASGQQKTRLKLSTTSVEIPFGQDGGDAIAFECRMVRTTGGQPQTELAHCLRADANAGDGAPCVAFAVRTANTGANGHGISAELAHTLDRAQGQAVAGNGSTVRRLTPIECERLQGFPDGWTRIPWRGKPADACPDGPRYKAIGNSMAVPVMRWIGDRIKTVQVQISG